MSALVSVFPVFTTVGYPASKGGKVSSLALWKSACPRRSGAEEHSREGKKARRDTPHTCDAWVASIESFLMGVALCAHDACVATGGTLRWGSPDTLFTSVSIDSRHTAPRALFVPLAGERVNGHSYISAAVECGAAGFLFSSSFPSAPPDGATGIAVADPLAALQDLATWHRRRLSARVIGIAGSNGKTTTKELMAQVFTAQRPTQATQGNLNNHIGLPLTLLCADPEDAFLVLEMGTSGPGELALLGRFAQPHIGVITSISEEHTETLGDLSGVLAAETELLTALPPDGVAIVNGDDPLLLAAVRQQTRCRTVTFGAQPTNQVRASRIQVSRTGTRFDLHVQGQYRQVQLPLIGSHCVPAALATIAAVLENGLDLDTTCATLRTAQGAPRRLAPLRIPTYQLIVLDDCYNANPASMQHALQTANTIRQAGERLILVLGDMLELGAVSELRHREIGAYIAGLKPALDTLVTVGQYAPQLAEAVVQAGLPAQVFPDAAAAVPCVRELVRQADGLQLMLVKGSRGVHLERIVESFVDRNEKE